MKNMLLVSILTLCCTGAALAEPEAVEPLNTNAKVGDSVSSEKKQETSFYMPVPDDWATETIPFPLGFAPQLDYEGFEELRFAPGMFTPENEDFWTYAFVWWIPASTTINQETLQRDLNAYYGGLAQAVAEGKGNHDIPAVLTRVNSVAGNDGSLKFAGTIETFDAFVTMETVSLNFQAEVITCASQDQVAVFFEVSPQLTTHPVWVALHEIRQGFRCNP